MFYQSGLITEADGQPRFSVSDRAENRFVLPQFSSADSLQGASFTSVRMLIEAIQAFVTSWNQKAAPFEWTKAEVHQQQMKQYYSYLRN